MIYYCYLAILLNLSYAKSPYRLLLNREDGVVCVASAVDVNGRCFYANGASIDLTGLPVRSQGLHRAIRSALKKLKKTKKLPLESSKLSFNELDFKSFQGIVRPITGHESFFSRYKSILLATKSLDIQTLHFKGDASGIELGHQLIRRASEGIKIRILIDALAPFVDFGDKVHRLNTYILYRNLMASGIPVYGFDCRSAFWNLWREWKRYGGLKQNVLFWKRSHEKIWLQDNKMVIFGGHNIANEYFRLNEIGLGVWRDQDILFSNTDNSASYPIEWARNQFEVNLDYYIKRHGKFVVEQGHGCRNPYNWQNEEYKYFLNQNSKNYITYADKGVNELIQSIIEISEYNEEELEHRIADLWKEWSVSIIHSRPALKERKIEQVYLQLINSAQSEIIISNSYFVPSPPILSALKLAIKRGVKISILTNGDITQEKSAIMLSKLSMYYYFPLKSIGPIDLYEWIGRREKSKIQEFGMFHGKICIIDQKLSIIGSYNFDNVSRDKNSELITVIQDEQMAKKLAKDFFEQDLLYAKKYSLWDTMKAHVPGKRKDFLVLQLGKMLQKRL